MRRPAAPRRALARALVGASLFLTPLPAQAIDLCLTAANGDPVGTTRCPGVRPGSEITVGSSGCTLGFLFQGSDRRRYAATAGHCAYDPDPPANPGRTDVWRPGAGPVVKDADGRQIGRFAYATMKGSWVDFGLVRLDPGVASDPAMCHFGGPTRIATEVHDDDVLVHHYGHGIGMESVPARTGDMFWGLYREDYALFYGVSTPGDSGGPVIAADGAAIGVVTDLTYGTGTVGANRLPANLAAAAKALRLKSLTLLTAPRN